MGVCVACAYFVCVCVHVQVHTCMHLHIGVLIFITYTLKLFLLFMQSFPNEMPIFLREYGSGLYRTDVYYLAKNLAEVMMFIVWFCWVGFDCFLMVSFRFFVQSSLFACMPIVQITRIETGTDSQIDGQTNTWKDRRIEREMKKVYKSKRHRQT